MTIWRNLPTLDQLNASASDTLIRHLDIVFSEIGDDFLCATMPVDGRTRQPFGLLHGGASVALAETVGSTAASLCLLNPDTLCVGQEINANHLRAVRRGHVTATARPVHVGGRTQVWGIEIANETGDLVCVSRLTVAVVKVGTLGL